MKRILIAGGSHSDIPLIQAARAHGYHVITSGNRTNDLGHRHADEVHLEDFSDQEAMLSLAKQLRIDAICSSANDFSVITCAYIAEKLGLPGFDNYETTLTLHHKDRFRALTERIGLPCPVAKSFRQPEIAASDLDGIPLPWIVKPIDLTGGKGVTRIDDAAELPAAVERAFAISRAKRIVIENFFTGSLHSYSSFIRNGKVIFDYADDEHSYLNPYLVSTSTSPAVLHASILPALRSITERLAHELRLVDGILHAQFLADGKDFRIIEYTRRCPGDFYAIPVRHSTNIDHADMIVRPCLGLELPMPAMAPQIGWFSRHCVMADRTGKLVGIRYDDEICTNVLDTFTLLDPGAQIRNHLVDKAAIVFLTYHSAAEMEDKNRRVSSLIRAAIE